MSLKEKCTNLFVKGKTNMKENVNNLDHTGNFSSKDKKKGKKKGRLNLIDRNAITSSKEGHIKKYCYDYIKKQK